MVAFDVDGVLADSIHGFVRLALRETGADPAELGRFDDYADPFTPWPERFRPRVQELFQRAYFAGEHGVYGDADVVPGALEGVRALHAAGLAGGYVTRRPATLHELTRDWLRRRGFPDLPVHHAPKDVGKAPQVRALRARVMVEDAPVEAGALAAEGLVVLLRHEAYNGAFEAPGVERCDGWPTIARRALELARD
ncbi:MAG: hypothetical protein P1P87_02300 [Trueperaceae bacterium]|nr:hypothetical protein [Trueperaceae bacterium]